MHLTTAQTFRYQEIHRSQITPAPYNPRTINASAEARLRENLARIGLLTTLVWNSRTGHLVGGHCRLAIVDELEGSLDYVIGVAAIDVDEATERALKVFLNNTWAQGEFDHDKLMAMLAGQGAEVIAAMGWAPQELLLEYGAREELAAIMPQASPAPRKTAQDTLGPHVMLVFRTNEDKQRFLRHLGRPEDLMRMSADELHDYIEPEASWRAASIAA